MIYIVKLKNDHDDLIKLDYTSNLQERLDYYKDYFSEVSLLWTFEDPEVKHYRLEKDLNSVYLKSLTVRPVTYFGGYTECYHTSSFNYLIKTLKEKSLESYYRNTQPSLNRVLTATNFTININNPSLLLCTAFKSLTTGEVIKFDGVLLKIYLYMLGRYNFYQTHNADYIETFDRICTAATGMDYRGNGTNRGRIKTLRGLGLIDVETDLNGKILVGGVKVVNTVDDILTEWQPVNEQLDYYDSKEGREERKKQKLLRGKQS
ncbi:TPA: GIY-YIG nuclease family protein [Vibrio cholerae]